MAITSDRSTPYPPDNDPVSGVAANLDGSVLPDGEARYRRLFERAPMGMLYADAESRYLDANQTMCEMLGYSRDELIGMHATDIIAPSELARIPEVLEVLHARSDHHHEWEFRRKDGTILPVDVFATRFPDGTLLGMVRDISELRESRREIERMSRLYAALSQINQSIVWTSSREELFEKICRIIVEFGGLRMAWIGWHDPETRRLAPVAVFGDHLGHVKNAQVYTDDRPEGRGPAGTAFKTGQPYVCNDLLNDPATEPWRALMAQYGFLSCAAFPIRLAGEPCGTILMYAERREFFHDKEMALLEEAAVDVSFALDNFAREAARREAERQLREEKLFSDTMIESMPGILYFYDASGRFLRWNKNFETVSGYTGEEIAGMHPGDFFMEEDRPDLESKIAEVFERGESTLEAPFIAKDGMPTPYLFTGRRINFQERTCLVGVGVDMTERKKAELDLRQSEQRFRNTLDGILEGCQILGFDWRYVYLNHAAALHNRRPNEELLGEVYTEMWPGVEHSRAYAMLRRCMEERVPQHDEMEFVFPDGARGWFDLRAVPAPEGILVLSIDMTERKLAESKLRESEAHLVEAQRIAGIGSWEHDIQQETLKWSAQTYSIFGIEATEFNGTYEEFMAFVHPEDRARLREAHDAALAGLDRLDIEHRIVLRDGSEKVVHELADLKRDPAGNVISLSGTVHDITHRVRMEAERERRHRAEEADRIKSAFLATMSHELRTPLNSIIGFTGIVLQGLAGPLNEEQGKQLDMVRSSARHLLALVNDVLDISKIEAGQFEVAREPFDPHACISKVIATVRPQVEAKGLEMRQHIARKLGEALGDSRRFEQVLLNLLSNAIKFTDHGAIEVTAILLDSYEPDGGGDPVPAIRLSVKDTGMGVKPEDLPELFLPFRQIDSGLSRNHEGTGLGLAICQRLVNLMGGGINAESEWGRGSTFTVTLPVERPERT